MNKVYKVLFNKSTGKYVVVSENSKIDSAEMLL